MSSSPERVRSAVLRRRDVLPRGQSDGVVPARLGEDPLTSPYAVTSQGGTVDPRLVDHRLEPAFRAVVDVAVREARVAGHAEGYAAGWAEARQEAQRIAAADAERVRALDEERAMAIARVCAALDDAAATAQRTLAPTIEGVEALALETAMQIVLLVLGRALPDEERIVALIRRALTATDGAAPLTVRLHPQDAALVDAAVQAQVSPPGGRRVGFVADESCPPGSCLVEDGDAQIDASLLATLERVRDALTVGTARESGRPA